VAAPTQATAKLRRTPRQRRSQATVDALLTAATQVLARDGFEGFTTTRTAERAGVSIGSLYQYFRDRDALLGAVAARELRRLAREVGGRFADAEPGQRTEAVSRVIMANMFAASAESEAALRCVVAFTSRQDVGEEVRTAMSMVTRSLMAERRITEAEAYVLTRAVLGVASAALVDRPQLDPEALVQALTTLIRSFLQARRPA
jgi:AcrR family transcriptional regulator